MDLSVLGDFSETLRNHTDLYKSRSEVANFQLYSFHIVGRQLARSISPSSHHGFKLRKRTPSARTGQRKSRSYKWGPNWDQKAPEGVPIISEAAVYEQQLGITSFINYSTRSQDLWTGNSSDDTGALAPRLRIQISSLSSLQWVYLCQSDWHSLRSFLSASNFFILQFSKSSSSRLSSLSLCFSSTSRLQKSAYMRRTLNAFRGISAFRGIRSVIFEAGNM